MKKIVVQYMAKLPDKQHHISSLKLYNDGKKAANDVTNYMENMRPDLHWTYSTDEADMRRDIYPNVFALFFGFPNEKCDPDELTDTITAYELEFEDPENDPYRKFLASVLSEFEADLKTNEHTDYEKESFEHTIWMIRRLLDFTDDISS